MLILADNCDFHCKTDYKCLPQNQVCDGINHCTDGSDESYKCGEWLYNAINVNWLLSHNIHYVGLL